MLNCQSFQRSLLRKHKFEVVRDKMEYVGVSFLFVFFLPLWVIKRSSIDLYIYLFGGFNDADIQLFVVDDYVNENFGREQEVCFEKDVIWNQNETEND